MINKFLKLLAIFFLSIIIFSCSSRFEKDQRIAQEEYTQKTAYLVKEQFDSLSIILLNSLRKQNDVNKKTFENLTLKYNEISALILQNPDGKIIKIFPKDFSVSEIKSVIINNQIINSLVKNKNIKISPNILENDGKYLCLLIPIHDKNQNLENIISILLNSKTFFEPIEKKSFFPCPYSLGIINENKTILYNSNYDIIGSDFTFGDKAYPIIPLKELFKKMMENDSDYYITSSLNKDYKTEKLFTWFSISILDSKLWVSLTRDIRKSSKKKSTDAYLLSTLRSYAVKDTLIDAILDNELKTIEGILTDMYQLNPEIYAVQFADRKGIVVSGWPPENSSIGYYYKMKKSENFDNSLKTILIDKEEKIIISPLLEGGLGKFILIPITIDDEIIGVLYSIESGGR